MTSMYTTAPAMTSMYMPAGQQVAAPATGLTVPSTMPAQTANVYDAGVASNISGATNYYGVKVDTGIVAGAANGQFTLPPPVSLTAGLVTPENLEKEKVAYGKALEAQLKKQVDAINEEGDIKKKMLQQ